MAFQAIGRFFYNYKVHNDAIEFTVAWLGSKKREFSR